MKTTLVLLNRTSNFVWIILVIFLVFMPTNSKAQDLDDYRSAAAADGVDVIPWDNLHREARAIADEVQRSKAATKWKYDLWEKQKNNLLKEKKQLLEDIEDKKEEIEDFKRKHKESDTSSFEEDLEDLEKELKQNQDKIDDMNESLKEGKEAWDRLWNARGGLREIFEDAKREVDRAQSYPDKYLDDLSEDDKKTFISYLEVIEDEIELGEREHKKQEDGAKETAKKFGDLIEKNEL